MDITIKWLIGFVIAVIVLVLLFNLITSNTSGVEQFFRTITPDFGGA